MCVGSSMVAMFFYVSVEELSKMVDILQMIFSNQFLWKKISLFRFKFQSLLPGSDEKNSALVQVMA